ncbi:hypothetical protein UFOVP55_54 [uncultured Caudovirales phage]|uniref:Uncharacterized protein n=1 Tax=uncultured Caudovirales phage TaxID=2100421 RepID=A0A6J5KUS7_9CAUD|nr:hypothetical protein UFOVP55_54 [uncultured Caudovirales phage]
MDIDGLSTYLGKDHYKKWKATSTMMLGDKQQLTIATYKSHGTVRTYVSVGRLERGMVTHMVYKDYSKCLASEAKSGTEKNVAAQHRSVLSKFETILADVTRHYSSEPYLLA